MARQLTSGAEAVVEEVHRLVAGSGTPEELAARRAAVDEIRRLRAEMPPVDLTVEELLADDVAD
jgi:hypothetical protein